MLLGPTILPDNPKNAVIFCHGYGSNGADMYGLCRLLQADNPDTAFICPNGLKMITGGGYEWFSLDDWQGEISPDYLQRLMGRIQPATRALGELILDLRSQLNLETEQIILGGFSQGGLIALATGLTLAERVAGLIGMSSVPVVFGDNFPVSDVCHRPPVLLTHGLSDTVVPPVAVDWHTTALKKIGIEPQVILSDGLSHGLDDNCINGIKSFLGRINSPQE